MNPEIALAQRIAAEIRAEMAWQAKAVSELARVIERGVRATQRRYSGEIEFGLDEVEMVAEWLGVSKVQLLTGVRDRERAVSA
jgi:hypothetical protein